MTIARYDIKTSNTFLCIVKRPMCFNVFFTPERWECWKIIADTYDQAMKEAKYHFYKSRDSEIMVSKTPIKF